MMIYCVSLYYLRTYSFRGQYYCFFVDSLLVFKIYICTTDNDCCCCLCQFCVTCLLMRGQHRLTDDPDEFSFALFAVIFDTNTRFPYRLTCEKK